jgi:regulatory protein
LRVPYLNTMKNQAYLHAIRLLTKRNYSKAKLIQKLKQKEYTPTEIEEAVSEVIAKRYLKEDEYIESRIKNFMRRGDSPARIQQKLSGEGCHAELETVLSIFKEYEFTSNDQLGQLIEKKLRSTPKDLVDFPKKQKILQFLASRGHSREAAQSALEQYLDT